MKLPLGKPGIFRFVFVALLLVFNWPLLSIPAPENLLGWLFTAWALAIALLFLAAQGAGGRDAQPVQPTRPVQPVQTDGPDGPGAQGPDADSAGADPAPRARSDEGDGGV